MTADVGRLNRPAGSPGRSRIESRPPVTRGREPGIDGSRVPRWAGLWFAALMLVTVGVRLADPTVWLGSDDAAYHRGAEHLPAGKTIERVHHHNARMAVIAPVAASMALLGESPATVALPTFIASTLCVALVVLLGRLVWGWWEGLCAASVVSVLPYFRVLSTTAYPEVHACFWATLAMVLAAGVSRVRRPRLAVAVGVGCGLAISLATSAKIFSVIALVGVVVFLWTNRPSPRRDRCTLIFSVALGGLAYVVVDGLFYTWAAGDFLFKLHALQASEALDGMFPRHRYDLAGYAALAWERLTLLFRPASSGWGRIGMAFWPVVLLVALLNSRGRALALWAIAAYVLVAVMPVSVRYGVQPYPAFHGRHILVACIPIALCLAWVVRRGAAFAFRPARVEKSWPIALGVIVALAFVGRRDLNGFSDRATSRVGIAMGQLVASTDWDDDREIFMPPSLYLRYRILFPPGLRRRLRVAVSDDSLTWWRSASVDIVSRVGPLPPPEDAYLIATPKQLGGSLETWDYAVRLPRDALTAYQLTPPIARFSRFDDKTIKPDGGGEPSGDPLLLLIAAGSPDTRYSREDRDDPNVG